MSLFFIITTYILLSVILLNVVEPLENV